MGKYYSKHGRSLYIYVTENDELIDINLFPKELNLFEPDSSWRMNEKMAIVNDIDENDLDKAEIILNLNSFMKQEIPEETLEKCYNEGIESVLDTSLTIAIFSFILHDESGPKRFNSLGNKLMSIRSSISVT